MTSAVRSLSADRSWYGSVEPPYPMSTTVAPAARKAWSYPLRWARCMIASFLVRPLVSGRAAILAGSVPARIAAVPGRRPHRFGHLGPHQRAAQAGVRPPRVDQPPNADPLVDVCHDCFPSPTAPG